MGFPVAFDCTFDGVAAVLSMDNLEPQKMTVMITNEGYNGKLLHVVAQLHHNLIQIVIIVILQG